MKPVALIILLYIFLSTTDILFCRFALPHPLVIVFAFFSLPSDWPLRLFVFDSKIVFLFFVIPSHKVILFLAYLFLRRSLLFNVWSFYIQIDADIFGRLKDFWKLFFLTNNSWKVILIFLWMGKPWQMPIFFKFCKDIFYFFHLSSSLISFQPKPMDDIIMASNHFFQVRDLFFIHIKLIIFAFLILIIRLSLRLFFLGLKIIHLLPDDHQLFFIDIRICCQDMVKELI